MIETSKSCFWAHFFYNMFLYWLIILFISMMFFYWQVVSGWWKKLTKQSALTPISFTTHFIFLINKLNHCYNFSQLANFLFIKDFTQLNVFAWICIHLLCSIDNRLCELISNSCQITLCTQFAQIMPGWCKSSWYALTY